MPRPKKDIEQRRIELSWRDDEMMRALDREAIDRGVSLQQHIYDIVRARWLAQQGKPLAPFYGGGPSAPSVASESEPLPEEPDTNEAAGAAAAAWLDLEDE
jgi:hypothetical protein